MYQLVYVSQETRPFSENDLIELLKTSRRNNQRIDVTGILLYQNGRFVQVLEGPKDAVLSIFETIKADERHTNVHVAIEQSVDAREFGQWEMGFARVNNEATGDMEGMSKFLDTEATADDLRAQQTKVQAFLKLFQRLM